MKYIDIVIRDNKIVLDDEVVNWTIYTIDKLRRQMCLIEWNQGHSVRCVGQLMV